MSEGNSKDQPARKRSKKSMSSIITSIPLEHTLDDQQAADAAANYTMGPGHSFTDLSDDFIIQQITANKCVHGKQKAYFCRDCETLAKRHGIDKKFAFCDHGRQKQSCKDCNGSGMCEHKRQKSKCIECRGVGVCEHSKIKTICRECKENGTGGIGICDHGLQKSICKKCGRLSICEHSRFKRDCKECKNNGTGGGSICNHGSSRSRCKECKKDGIGGDSLCDHGRLKPSCKECKKDGTGGDGLCDHGRLKPLCKDCGGRLTCEHSELRYICKECKTKGTGGGGLCDHYKRKSRCKDCKGSSICRHKKHKTFCKDCKGSAICSHNKVKYRCTACKSLGMPSSKNKSLQEGVSICHHGIKQTECPECLDILDSYLGCAKLGATQPLIEHPTEVTEPSTLEDEDINVDLEDGGFNHLIQCPQCSESKVYESFELDEYGMPSVYCQACIRSTSKVGGAVCSGGCYKILFGQDPSQTAICQNCISEQVIDDDCELRPLGQLDGQLYCSNCTHYLPITSFPDDVDRDNMPCCIACKVLIDHAPSADSAEHSSMASGN